MRQSGPITSPRRPATSRAVTAFALASLVVILASWIWAVAEIRGDEEFGIGLLETFMLGLPAAIAAVLLARGRAFAAVAASAVSCLLSVPLVVSMTQLMWPAVGAALALFLVGMVVGVAARRRATAGPSHL